MDSVVVVGAGVMGASLAWRLARGGTRVTLVDQFGPGDPRASSGGETRLIRCAHGVDPDYTASARRARGLWRELEAETGEALLEECGMAWFAHREDGWEAESLATLAAQGIPAERLEPGAAARLYPALGTRDLAFVLHEPEAGVLRAERSVRALARAAEAHGARVKRAVARPDGDAVALDDGRRLEADRVVWTCGPWLTRLFPEHVSLRVTRQELFFFDGGPEWAGVPGWVDYDRAIYGTGDVDGHGVKAAPDTEGPALDPGDPLPATGPDGERLARAYLAERFPSLAGAPLKSSRTCRYELSADSHFLAGPLPERPTHHLVGGGSGHGFKHGPALAEALIPALRDGAALPAHYALGPRAPGRSLRTAGSNYATSSSGRSSSA
ncbi:MAG TPA: FAD-dependent oxidoreductase [Solirubrobacteraceae bacterium]